MRSAPQRDRRRLLGMVLLGLVTALTMHGHLCGPLHEAGHHATAAHAPGAHGLGDAYRCRAVRRSTTSTSVHLRLSGA